MVVPSSSSAAPGEERVTESDLQALALNDSSARGFKTALAADKPRH